MIGVFRKNDCTLSRLCDERCGYTKAEKSVFQWEHNHPWLNAWMGWWAKQKPTLKNNLWCSTCVWHLGSFDLWKYRTIPIAHLSRNATLHTRQRFFDKSGQEIMSVRGPTTSKAGLCTGGSPPASGIFTPPDASSFGVKKHFETSKERQHIFSSKKLSIIIDY